MPNAKVYFTLDGSTPTSNSLLYENPIYIDKTTTIKAFSTLEGWQPSNVVLETFTFKSKEPVLNFNYGVDKTKAKITMFSPTKNSIIYYTLDGSIPNINSIIYNGAIDIIGNTKVSAISKREGWEESNIVTKIFAACTTSHMLVVPADYLTIQTAINSAASCDTIYILPGTYKENLSLKNKKLVLMSNELEKEGQFISQTIIDGHAKNRVFNITDNSQIEINGISIINGGTPYDLFTDLGGGIFCQNSKLIIKNSIIKSNWAYHSSTGVGGGLYLESSDAELTNVELSGNGNGAIYCINSFLQLEKTRITDNYLFGMYDVGAGGVTLKGSNFIFSNVTISNNEYGKLGDTPLITAAYKISDLVLNSFGKITNSVIWKDSLYIDSVSSVKIEYSDLDYLLNQSTNHSFDPLFVSNYRLSSNSPCIDTGLPDIKDPDSTCSDIGAYYFNQKTIADFTFKIDTLNQLSVQFKEKSRMNDFGDSIKSWQWLFGDGGISVEQNPVHLYNEGKTYSVNLTIIDKNNRISSISKTVDIPVNTFNQGLDKVEDFITVYPNPTMNGITSICFNQPTVGDIKIEIFNSMGASLKILNYANIIGPSTIKVDLSPYSSGLYFMRTFVANKQFLLKIVKK